MTTPPLAASSVVLTLPLPPSINRQRRNHWAVTRKLKQEWERNAYYAWMEAGSPKHQQVTVTPVFYFGTNHHHDIDNYTGGTCWKGIWDGLKGHLMPDDRTEHLRIGQAVIAGIDRDNPRLELHIDGRG